jgi:hypothetical protein
MPGAGGTKNANRQDNSTRQQMKDSGFWRKWEVRAQKVGWWLHGSLLAHFKPPPGDG